ncbi:unnamed protein product [Alternaria sp. RS040]
MASADATSAKKSKSKPTKRKGRSERRSEPRAAMRDRVQSHHSQELRDHNGKLKHFPLLRLPAELRNAIYEHVFSDTQYDFDVSCMVEDDTRASQSFNECNLGLIAASRQLHAETRLLPYSLAVFRFDFEHFEDEWQEPVQRFVDLRTKEQRGAIGDNMMVIVQQLCSDWPLVYYGSNPYAY